MSKLLARLVIVAVILFTGISTFYISKLKFDYEFEHFFPTNDPDLDFYRDYMKDFAPDVDFILVGAKNNKGIFHEEFLSDLHQMQTEISTLTKVRKIISPFNAKDYAIGPFGPMAIPYLHFDDPESYAIDSARIFKYQKGVGSLFSSDAKSLSILIEVMPGLSKLETDTLYQELTAITNNYHFDEFHLSGKAIGQAYYIEQIKYEFAFFFTLGVILIIGILILVYRSFWGVFVPLLVVLLSVIWLLGIMGMADKPIDIMTILLPLILFVVGIADVIHLLSRYFEEIRNGLEKNKAIRVAYKQVGFATFLTSLTTAIGFLTLVVSDIMPVRGLGIYAAIGVFIAFILAFTLLPAILSLTAVPQLAYKEPSSLFWNKLVKKIFLQSIHYPSRILAITGLVSLLSIVGLLQIKVDNFLLEDVGENDPTRLSFEFFEKNFAGVRPFDMHVSVLDTNRSLFDFEIVQELQLLESYLINDYGVGFVISPLNVIRTANQALNGGLDSAYRVPADKNEYEEVLTLIKKLEKRPEFESIVHNQYREGRISGKITDIGGSAIKTKNQALETHFTQNAPLSYIEFRLTGMALLIDKSNESLSVDMVNGLFVAILIVALIVGLMFKSVKIALISLLPNVLPLLVIAGLMGFLDINLKVATAIIFGIAFGIAVDDSIHFLSKYRMELAKGKSNVFAIRRTSISTGKAIILTSLILSAGFMSLATSDFGSASYVGILISITLAVAVLADLYLLPVLLLKFGDKKKS